MHAALQQKANEQCKEGIGELNYNTSTSNMNITSFCRGMVIVCLNINSLVAHIDELRIYINSARIDILCINETKLDQTIFDHEVCLPGFDIIRRDRSVNGRYGGGVCIYIRSNLNYKIVTRLSLGSESLQLF